MNMKVSVEKELECVRRLGTDPTLIRVASNMGVYEAVLLIVLAGPGGISITKTVDAVSSKFSSRSGILKRLKMLRDAGLIVTVNGKKRSQVNLVASEALLKSLGHALGFDLDHRENGEDTRQGDT